ncbi:MAG: CDP-glycerol glycerophosphotransferase family protein [Clostridia bacterium]|nr:CDP-glycerol glycerophosphotransferase family protein [Clostridia bacterium]
MFKVRLLNFFLAIFNMLTPKIKNSMFFNAGTDLKSNCVDIINNSSNNALHFINELIKRRFKEKTTVIIEYLDDERLPLYKKLVDEVKSNNIDLRFSRGVSDKSGFEKIKLYIKKYALLQKCKVWIVSTGDVRFYGKLKSQKIVNFNYFISCKNDFMPGRNYRWQFLDYMVTASMLHTTVSAAQTGVKYDNCVELGFPRNDVLFDASKRERIIKWITEEIGYAPKKIIVYAPTYRDYEKNSENEIHRSLFGYEIGGLEDFLKKSKICLVCKLHNLTLKSIVNFPKGVTNLKPCYDFTLYDLMAISDCLITDYSSVGYDFMLKDKPMIYNLYDLEMYEKDRGMSYEPYDEFCPGVIVKNAEEMLVALNDIANDKDISREKRQRLVRLFHKYSDNKSSKRAINFFCERFGLKICDD